jgi:hypothetical protein
MLLKPRLNPLPLFAATGGALLALCILMAAGPEEVFAALPLIGLLVALVFKRYPGERLIERLARRLHKRRPRPVSVALPRRHAAPIGFRLLPLLSSVRPLRGPPRLSSHPIS